MINPNIANNEGIYRSQIREFFEDRFGAFRDEGHYLSELKTFRNSYATSEENGYTTSGNYGSFDNIYATKKDVIIGFIEYWLTEGYQKYNRHNKYIINDEFAICDETDFTTIYADIIGSFDATELRQVATQEFAMTIARPNWLVAHGAWGFTFNSVGGSQIEIEYSSDGITWTTYTSGIKKGPDYIRGNNTRLKNITNNTIPIGHFITGRPEGSGEQVVGKYSCSGSVQSLIYGDDTENQYIICDYCFSGLFGYGGTGTSWNGNKVDLPATDLKPYCYSDMFKGSTIIQVPELPATTLTEGCYHNMFEQCNDLTSINPLPATTLAPYCYERMFYRCIGINLQQDVMYLPATKLEEGCYENMFYNNMALVNAPMLPAYKLAQYCYFGMFSGCTSLVNAPELPATELEICCYENMFHSCTSLQRAPELPAKFLPQQAYTSMFAGCTVLSYLKALFTELTWGSTDGIETSDVDGHDVSQNMPHNSIRGWLYNTNTSSSSILILHTDYLTDKSYEGTNLSGLTGSTDWFIAPTNWKIYGTRNYLHFKPVPSTSSKTNCQSWKLTIHTAAFNNANPTYSNGSFLDLNYRTTPYDISINTSTGVITNTYSWTHITTGSLSSAIPAISFSSDGIYITNALDYETRDIEGDYRWYNNNSDIENADGHQHFTFVPQDNSTNTQYIDIFGDLRSLFYLPDIFEDYDELPNNSYHKYWYDWSRISYMFMYNTYLRHIYTSINVKKFTVSMFEAAFYECPNLIYLPNFGTDPLIPLNYATFNSTFSGCTSLEYVFELPYLTYADEDFTAGGTSEGYKVETYYYTYITRSYNNMFSRCDNIKFLPNIFPLRYLCDHAYNGMFSMWSSSASSYKSEFKKMPEIIAVTGEDDCLSAMFGYCDLREVQCIPLTTIDNKSPNEYGTFRGMFINNKNLKTAMHTLPLNTLYTYTYFGTFESCSKLALAPKIQAQYALTDGMRYAFSGCSNLKYVNTSVTSSVTTPFNSTGNNTLKTYASSLQYEDKKGLLWIDNGQISGISRGYYKAALIQYSKNPETNIYEYDGEYWIYVKSRKFANGETYYVWRKYIEDFDNFCFDYNNASYPAFYVITKECIIPECKITALSQATNMSTISKQYTIIGYTFADFDFSNAINDTEDCQYTTHGHNNPDIFPKVLLI